MESLDLKIIGTWLGLWVWDCSIGECLKNSRNLSAYLERQIQNVDNESESGLWPSKKSYGPTLQRPPAKTFRGSELE